MGLNKKGFTTLGLIFIIVMSLVLMVVLGFVSLGATLVDDTMSELDFKLGNISFNETYQQQMRPAIIAGKTTMPSMISLGILMGMAIVMMFIGYNSRRIGSAWILLDIFILIGAEALAVLVSKGFVSFMNSSPEMFQVFTENLSAASKLIINLPIIIPTIGVLIMIATHYLSKEKEKEEDVF